MLNHYGVLESDHKQALKKWMDSHKINTIKKRKDATVEEIKEIEALMREMFANKPNPYENREQKIAEFKMKKAIQTQLDTLNNYHDEETRREFYMAQIKLSILTSFEQLRTIEMESEMLKHQASLTP
mmetsp:Transcript_18477/g.31624  ORF Transcript_18477/g.31624 Transcript_18477/m.31624 type:complete len:127 (-) Transcript_18477:548-928(-)